MTTDTNLQFIRKKLDQIRNGIMYNMNNDIVKLPNDVIQYLEMDDNGQLWFGVNKPKYMMNSYEQCFPVRLRFYQKEVNFYIDMTGTATIYTKTHLQVNEKKNPELILLTMTPAFIEYTETKKKSLSPKPMGLFSFLSNWLLNKMQLNNVNRQAFSKL